MADIRETNDPDEILKQPLYKVLERLDGDMNRLYALGEVDKAVLRGLVGGKGSPRSSPGSGQDERLEAALRYVEAVAKNAAAARRAIEGLRSGE